MTTKTPDTVLAERQQQLAALGSEGDCRSDNERERYFRGMLPIRRDIRTLTNVPQDLAKLEPRVAAVDKWVNVVLTPTRRVFTKELATIPTRGRTRAQEERVLALTTAIKQIDQGCEFVNGWALLSPLLADKIKSAYEPSWDMPSLDPWAVGFGPLPEAKARLAELTAKRDALQAQLDAAMQEREVVPT